MPVSMSERLPVYIRAIACKLPVSISERLPACKQGESGRGDSTIRANLGDCLSAYQGHCLSAYQGDCL
jgi:hypothetical protein